MQFFSKTEIVKKRRTVIGWASAVLCVVAGTISVVRMGNKPLSLMLRVDGNDICIVENSDTVNNAVALLDSKFRDVGGFGKHNIEYRLVSDDRSPLNADECADRLYETSMLICERAYCVYANGIKIGCCPTYGEASDLIDGFKTYLENQISSVDKSGNKINITSDFSVESCFCLPDDILSADEIYNSLTGSTNGIHSVNGLSKGVVELDAVTPKTNDRAVLSNENAETDPQIGTVSFSIKGVLSAISYNTTCIEKYSEVIPYETEYIETDELCEGESVVSVQGKDGIADDIYEITYSGEIEIDRVLTSREVKSPAVSEVILIGTKPINSTGVFKFPIKGRSVITTYFGDKYTSGGSVLTHSGIDIGGMTVGTPVYASDGGKVIFASADNGNYGLTVKIKHLNGSVTCYAHLNSYSVSVGDIVASGQQIGEVGLTGITTGSHLHFEIIINELPVDPLKLLTY